MKRRRALASLGAAVGLLALFGVVAFRHDRYPVVSAASQPLVLRGGVLFDARGGPPVEGASVVVEQGRIRCAGTTCEAPPGARQLDLGGAAILPGLADLHVHLSAPSGIDANRSLPGFVWDTLRGRPGLRRALHEAGITTIRSPGDSLPVLTALREGLASGQLEGPRLHFAGPYFTAVGGHPAGTFLKGNDYVIEQSVRQVDDVEAAKRGVREAAALGASWIKLVDDRGESVVPAIKPQVLRAAVEEARALRLRVAVHIHSLEGLKEAAALRVDSIEHTPIEPAPLDAETIEALRASGAAWVPTLAVQQALAGGGALGTMEPEVAAQYAQIAADIKRALPAVRVSVKRAFDAGVRVGAGTDCLGPGLAYGEALHRELEALVELGLPPAAALMAATAGAATVLGTADVGGTVEEGKQADLLVVDGRPWERIGELRRVRLVVQGGRVVVDRR